MSYCGISSGDPNSNSCEVVFPRPSSGGSVPAPVGPDGILSWDDTAQLFVTTGILPIQVENVVGRSLSITGASNPSTIATQTFGSYLVVVNPPAANYPSATFTISKSNPAVGTATVLVHSAVAGSSGNTLQVVWPAGAGIQVQKIMPTEDGSYQVSVVGI
ncbi:MAG: hypothetical protein ACRC1D_02340 [Culicoidibacterales bacterium]